MMMDKVFGEANRLAILNWRKTTVKNNPKHVPQTTEYVLVSGDAKCARPCYFYTPQVVRIFSRIGEPGYDS
jgi:hypothetical protein